MAFPIHKVDFNGHHYQVVADHWTKIAPNREVEVAGNLYRIEGGALPELEVASFCRTRLLRASEAVLKLVPSVMAWAVTVGVIVFLGVIFPGIWIGFVAERGWAPETARDIFQGVAFALCVWGLPAFVAWSTLGLVFARCWFDRQSGRAVRWSCPFYAGPVSRKAWDVELDVIVAVQCLHVGWVKGKGGWIDYCQVNLALKNNTRVEVCCEGHGKRAEAWVRSLSRALADFLKVPLVDQIEETWVPKPRLRWD